MSKGELPKLLATLVGDSESGKASFVSCWGEDVPSAFEPCFIKVMVGDQEVLVVIRDSPEELESLRTIAYQNHDIFLLFFS